MYTASHALANIDAFPVSTAAVTWMGGVSTGYPQNLIAHKDAIVLAEVQGPRVQTQYKQEYLATLLTADTIFGVGEIYDLGGIAIAMPST